MRFTFDPSKNALNIKNHRVALSEAEKLDWDSLIATEDARKAYGEQRMVGYAPMVERLY